MNKKNHEEKCYVIFNKIKATPFKKTVLIYHKFTEKELDFNMDYYGIVKSSLELIKLKKSGNNLKELKEKFKDLESAGKKFNLFWQITDDHEELKKGDLVDNKKLKKIFYFD